MPDPHRDGLARLAASAYLLARCWTICCCRRASRRTRRGPRSSRPVDLVALARSVVAEEADRIRARRLTVVVDGPPRPLVVDGIESALRRAVGEVLSNAISHTPAGGRIEVVLSHSAGMVQLAVTDTGPGFDPAAVDQLFQRFHRGSGDGGRYGLGLALLREVVTRHGGTVAAAGRPGRGARLTIRLPEHVPAAPVPKACGRGTSAHGASARGGSRVASSRAAARTSASSGRSGSTGGIVSMRASRRSAHRGAVGRRAPTWTAWRSPSASDPHSRPRSSAMS